MSRLEEQAGKRSNLSDFIAHPKEGRTRQFTVEHLIKACPELELGLVGTSKGLSRSLTKTKVQLLGLALADYTDDLEPGSVQVLGKAEVRFIQERAVPDSGTSLQPIFDSNIGCFIVPDAHGSDLSPYFLKQAAAKAIPILGSPLPREKVEARVIRVLEEELAPSISFHGDLVVLCGLGILIIGRSGIGKSDCALDLITHGHQLVADDMVHIRRNPLDQLIGKGVDLIRHHMDIRGLGIVNVQELFSVYSVIEEHSVDFVIFLEDWMPKTPYCLKHESTIDILNIPKPLIHLPVTPGRNWVNLIQVAVRNFILKSKGYDAEQSLSGRLSAEIDRRGKSQSEGS